MSGRDSRHVPMRYSIIIPIYDPTGKNDELTSKCLLSILKNSSNEEYEIIPVWHTDLNYSTAVNVGLKRSTGEFLIICSNDIEINDPEWLKKYTVPNAISSWRMIPFYLTHKKDGSMQPDASCWGMSRMVMNKVGLLDEIFKDGYGWEDTDYWVRCKDAGILFHDAGANLKHHENQTFIAYFSPEKEAMTQRNESLFLQKYNGRFND